MAIPWESHGKSVFLQPKFCPATGPESALHFLDFQAHFLGDGGEVPKKLWSQTTVGGIMVHLWIKMVYLKKIYLVGVYKNWPAKKPLDKLRSTDYATTLCFFVYNINMINCLINIGHLATKSTMWRFMFPRKSPTNIKSAGIRIDSKGPKIATRLRIGRCAAGCSSAGLGGLDPKTGAGKMVVEAPKSDETRKKKYLIIYLTTNGLDKNNKSRVPQNLRAFWGSLWFTTFTNSRMGFIWPCYWIDILLSIHHLADVRDKFESTPAGLSIIHWYFGCGYCYHG